MLSQEGLQAALATATSEQFCELLVFNHSTLSEPLQLVNDKQNLPTVDGVFQRFPFTVRAMSQDSEKPPTLGIEAGAVDQRIVQALRTLAGLRERAKITYKVVRRATPDTIEFGPVVFDYQGAQTNGATSLTIEAAYLKGALNDAFPTLQFTPSNRG